VEIKVISETIAPVLSDAMEGIYMQSRTGLIVVAVVVLTFLECGQRYKDAVPLEVDFQWNPPCTSLFISPEIRISGTPEGTQRFLVSLTDLDLPGFDHGSGFATYTGGEVIKAGAVEGAYRGPSPPYGSVHRYEIQVEARNAENKTIAIDHGHTVKRGFAILLNAGIAGDDGTGPAPG
jgi:phosphatidylethanolamine-binding protein (PEBP) family uncharacterized protein